MTTMRLLLLLLLGSSGCSLAKPNPDPESADTVIAQGRSALERGDPQGAEVLFQRAASIESDTFRPRMWILRAWMDQGRSNDTLDELDRLARAGQKGPEMDYLYGMAFARRADGYLASGVTDSSITMNFQDAVLYLTQAVEARPDEFRDAFQPLASAAWYTQELEKARAAAERAVVYYPSDGLSWFTLGRVAMSQFVVEQELEAWSPSAEEHWRAARDAFAQAVEVLGSPAKPALQAMLSDAALQLGHVWTWKEERAEAADSYGIAIAWAPDTIDYALLRSLLGAEGDAPEASASNVFFNQALERGAAGFREQFGAEDRRDGTLLWWLGWSRSRIGQPAEAEEAFLAVLKKVPDFASAWFYVALARYDQQDWNGFVDALRTGWESAPDAILAEMRREPEANAAKAEQVLGQIHGSTRLLDRALLAEISAETLPDLPRHWNNLGLFLRDEAERLQLLPDQSPNPRVVANLYERAYVAYSRALELAPEDPQLLNDTAVMLHYHLDRDLDRALAMYEKALELAATKLADPALSEEDRERFETARSDAETNKQALEELIASRKAG